MYARKNSFAEMVMAQAIPYKLLFAIGPFSIRLVTINEKTSPNLTAGRVEFYFSGKWGSVCVNGFSRIDASSVCSALINSSTVLRYGRVGTSGVG